MGDTLATALLGLSLAAVVGGWAWLGWALWRSFGRRFGRWAFVFFAWAGSTLYVTVGIAWIAIRVAIRAGGG